MNSQTPRTDYESYIVREFHEEEGEEIVPASFARKLEHELYQANARATEVMEIARELADEIFRLPHFEGCRFEVRFYKTRSPKVIHYCTCELNKLDPIVKRLEALERKEWKLPKAGSVTTPTSGHQKINATTIP